MTDRSAIAKSYAEALFLLSEEEGSTEVLHGELGTVRQSIGENPTYTAMLDSPALTREERLRLVDEAFSSLDKNIVNLLKILTEKRKMHCILYIIKEYGALYDASRGIERVEAISAVRMSDAQLNRLCARLEAITGKKIIISNTQDPELIGGVKLRYLGIQLDSTVKSRLDSLAEALSGLTI